MTRALAAALAIASAIAPAIARAGNDDGVLLGNEAAMTGGAVTATTSDGSAVWYNPAGLISIDRTSIDVSGSATMLRIGDTPELLRGEVSGARANGGYVEFLGIPSAVTMVRRLDPAIAFGLAIFVPQLVNHTDRVILRERVATAPPGFPDEADWQLTYQESTSTYFGGVSLAFELLPNVRIGATLFGAFEQYSISSQASGALSNDGDLVYGATLNASSNIQNVSLDIGIGLQWELYPGLHLGLTIRSPGVTIASQVRNVRTELISTDTMGGMFELADESGLEARFDLARPARVRLGLAYRWDSGWIGIDGDFQHALVEPNVGVQREWVGGARIGGRVTLDPSVAIGAGFFTDLDPTRRIEQFGYTRVDFFGGTLGLELRTPHRLDDDDENAPDEIVFISTFALRYAVGVGHIGGISLDAWARQRAEPIQRTVETRSNVHEISLHIGSALLF